MEQIRGFRPFFKWSGGKRREISIFEKHIPDLKDCRYVEPFVGGGSLWLYLNHNNNWINDNYKDLINFYNVLKFDANDLISKINEIAIEYNSIDKEKLTKSQFDEIGQQYYYYYRDTEFHTSFEKAVRFFLMRQLSFSGMLRFNSSGKFNVPFGWYKRIPLLDINQINLNNFLSNTEISCKNWYDVVKSCGSDDFVFLDPPYTRQFTKYSPNNDFGNNEHEELAEWFKNSDSRNMIILNLDEFTNGLYKDYIVHEYKVDYKIRYRDRMTEKDSNAIHFIAINYPTPHLSLLDFL